MITTFALLAYQRHVIRKTGSVAILTDHVHLTIGCGLNESPEEVALSYLNNLAHAGGFVGGYLAGALLGSRERRPERPAEDIVASVVIVLTVASFVLALWTTFAR